jgi:hypothetical protein
MIPRNFRCEFVVVIKTNDFFGRRERGESHDFAGVTVSTAVTVWT